VADVRTAIRYALDEKDEQEASAGAGARRATVERGLTKRQQVVARLVAEGLTNREIAARLYISERTAEGHVEQIRNKMGFSSRSQVAAWAVQNLPPE
jgi:DNA-binding NarL/FixJ family response regulator